MKKTPATPIYINSFLIAHCIQLARLTSSYTPEMTTAVPQWVCTRLGIPVEDVACLQVDTTSSRNYYAFVSYFSHRGVNLDEEAPSLLDEEKLTNSPVTEKSLHVRECSGELSRLLLSSAPCKEYANVHFGVGNSYLCHEGHDIYAVHSERGPPVGTDCSASIFRVLEVYAKSGEILRNLANSVLRWHHARQRDLSTAGPGKYYLYTLQFYPGSDTPEWESRGEKMSRSLDSVILPDLMLQRIVEDVGEFNNEATRDWYTQHGLPYRRSFLFHGKPGTGKTSTVRALAGALGLSACFLSLGDRRIGNPELQSVLADLPHNALLVIEDIDALFNEDRKSDNPSPLTFSGLLNALDGLISEDGIITIMTTNHIERLDPALIRAGRVDRKFEFNSPTKEMVAKFFRSFYPQADNTTVEEFAELVFKRPEPEARSLAALQEHFIYTRGKNAEECVKMLDQFFVEFYPMLVRMNNSETKPKVANGPSEMNDAGGMRIWGSSRGRGRGRGHGGGRRGLSFEEYDGYFSP